MRRFRLSHAVRLHRYKLVLCKRPHRHRDRIGNPDADSSAALLTGRRIAVPVDSWDYAYAAAHEIAEHVCGFDGHSAEMFCEQANILSIWCRYLSGVVKVSPGAWHAGPHLRDVEL